MNFKHFTKLLKALLIGLGATATVTLSGCPALGAPVDVRKVNTTYLCELSIENTKINIKNIIESTERTNQGTLIIFYDAYKNNLINIQQECPEDNQEAWGIQETEPLVNSLWEYKLKSLKD